MTLDAARRVAKGDGWRQWADYWQPGECFDFWQALRHALDLEPAKQSNGGLPPKRKEVTHCDTERLYSDL
jgi:hypothetical protein